MASAESGGSCLRRGRANDGLALSEPFTLHIRLPTYKFCSPAPPSLPVCARQPHTSTDTLDTVALVVARLRRRCRRSPPSSTFAFLSDVAMPSLRRTLSSPSVRSSPYSYPSNPSSNGHATRAGDRQPRRSSGSDTSNRRVLADIDWWIVQDGQRDVVGPSGGEQDSDEQDAAENEQVRPVGANVMAQDAVTVPPPAVATIVASAPVLGAFEDEIISSPLWDVSVDNSFGSGSPEVC